LPAGCVARREIALALRAKANALFASDDNLGAVEHHDQAFKSTKRLKIWKEAARTLSNSIQPLILLGEYDRAFAASERARQIFTQLGEERRLASLDNNVGNIFHRQDRFEEALAHYGARVQSAHRLRRLGARRRNAAQHGHVPD